MSNEDNRPKLFRPPSADDPVWSAQSAKDRADRITEEERQYAELLDTLREVRNQVAHDDVRLALSLDDEIGDQGEVESPNMESEPVNIRDFGFSSVGSVDAAMHTARPFSSGPVLQVLSESTPHELAALKAKAIEPVRLGLSKPDDFSDEEYADVVSTYAGAELLDRERRFNETMAQKAHSREGWKMFLQVAIPIITLILGSIATYFGMKN